MRCGPPCVIMNPRARLLDLRVPRACSGHLLVTAMEEQGEDLDLAWFPMGFGRT